MNRRVLKRYRKYELDLVVEEYLNKGFKILLAPVRASDYYQDCLDSKVSTYYPIDSLSVYKGYVAVLEKRDEDEY